MSFEKVVQEPCGVVFFFLKLLAQNMFKNTCLIQEMRPKEVKRLPRGHSDKKWPQPKVPESKLLLYQQTRSRQNLGEPGKGAKVWTSERGRGHERPLKRKMTRQGGVQKEPGHDVRGI